MALTSTESNTGQMKTEENVSERKYVLNTSHRCDKCGVQAYVRVFMKESGLELLFCKHHHNKYELMLIPVIDHESILDESDRLRDVNRLVGSENS